MPQSLDAPQAHLDGEALHCSQTATHSERRQASQCLQLVCRPRYAYCNAARVATFGTAIQSSFLSSAIIA